MDEEDEEGNSKLNEHQSRSVPLENANEQEISNAKNKQLSNSEQKK